MSIKKIIKRLKTKLSDGSLSNDIPIGADAENVFFTSGHTLDEVVGNIDIDTDGDIATQLANGGGGSSERGLVFNTTRALIFSRSNAFGEIPTLKDGDVVTTNGYHEEGVGAARFKIHIYDTQQTVDSVTTINITKSSLDGDKYVYATIIPEGQSIDLVQLGAGNYSNEDSAPYWNAAIQFCQTKGLKLTVSSYKVSYRIQNPITITGGIEIEGINTNKNFPLITIPDASYGKPFYSNADGPVFNITPLERSSDWRNSIVSIKNLTIQNLSNATTFGFKGVSSSADFANSATTILENISIKCSTRGWPHIRIQENASNIIFRNFRIRNGSDSGATKPEIIEILSATQGIAFYDCKFYRASSSSSNLWFTIDSAVPISSVYVSFCNCYIADNLTAPAYETTYGTRFVNCIRKAIDSI